MVESDKLTAKLTDFDVPTRKLIKGKTRVISFKCEKVNCGFPKKGEYNLSHISYIMVDEPSFVPRKGSFKYNYYLTKVCINNCLANFSDSIIQEQKDEFRHYEKMRIVFWFIATILSFFSPIPKKDRSYEINEILNKYEIKK